MMHMHGGRDGQAGGGAPADDTASCLFDLMSIITHTSCVCPAAFCHFLHLIAAPPEDDSSCLWFMALGTFWVFFS